MNIYAFNIASISCLVTHLYKMINNEFLQLETDTIRKKLYNLYRLHMLILYSPHKTSCP